MTHEEIDRLPPGPELDELACRAVGWKAKRRVCMCDGQECRSPKYCGAMVYPPISTELNSAFKALSNFHVTIDMDGSRAKLAIVAPLVASGYSWAVATSDVGIPGAISHAIARALVKLAAGGAECAHGPQVTK